MTIKNAKDAQVFKEQRFTKNVLFQEGKSTAFILNFLPGQSLPSHPHPNAHVYLFVIEGSGVCTIDNQQQEIMERDVIHCEHNQMLSVENTGNEPLSIYVVLAKEA